MKFLIKVFSILILVQFTLINPVCAWEIKDRNEFLLDIRDDDGDIYLNRISIHEKIESPDIKISVFLESQWNFDTDEWERVLAGLEARKDLWRYLYIGQSVQFISGQMLDYMAFDTGNISFDTTTRIGLHVPFLKYFSFDVFEEYSFNLEEGEDEYAESVAEVTYGSKNLYSIAIGWRHTDRIHNFDTDYASVSLSLHF